MKAGKHSFGFAETTSLLRTIKIWSLASDCETLITGQASPKQAALGLILNHEWKQRHDKYAA